MAYGVGHRELRLIRTYWGRLAVVTRAGVYYGPTFKGYHIFDQAENLSPTLFNVVMESVIRHWMKVAAATEAGTEGLGLSIRDLVA